MALQSFPGSLTGSSSDLERLTVPGPMACGPLLGAGIGGRSPDVLAGHHRMISGRQMYMQETADVTVTCQFLTDSWNLVWS